MRQFKQVAGVAAIMAMLLPVAVLADQDSGHGLAGIAQSLHLNLGASADSDHGNTQANANANVQAQTQVQREDRDNDADTPHPMNRELTGTVTAIGSASFEVKTLDSSVVTVNVSSDTRLQADFGGPIVLSNLQVNDKVEVRGTKNASSQIDATLVIVSPPNTHPAIARGTVTSVNGASFNVQTHDGLVVTVNTSSNTTFQKNGTHNTTTMAAVTVGSRATIRGLWDEIFNVLNAIRVRIF